MVEGNLRIRKIQIQRFGSIEDLTLIFNKRIALVEGTAWREILLAFRIVCGDVLSEEEKVFMGAESEIKAELQVNRRRCSASFHKDRLTGEITWELKPLGKGETECGSVERNVRTYLKDIPEKRKLRVLYDPGRQRIRKRFSEYETEDEEQREILFRETAGLSVTCAFRELLRERTYLILFEDKEVNQAANPEIDSFLKLNRFWSALDLERGTEQGIGPLVLTDNKTGIKREGIKRYLQEMRKQYEGQMIVVLTNPDPMVRF